MNFNSIEGLTEEQINELYQDTVEGENLIGGCNVVFRNYCRSQTVYRGFYDSSASCNHYVYTRGYCDYSCDYEQVKSVCNGQCGYRCVN